MEESAYEVIIMFLESMRRSFPNNSTVFSMLGEAYYRNGDRKQALSKLNIAISLDFFNGNAQALYAKLIREQSEL